VQVLRGTDNEGSGAGAAIVASGPEDSATPDQIGNAVNPGADRTQQNEPEDHCEQAVIALHADSLLDRAAPLLRVCGNVLFGQGLCGRPNSLGILGAQRVAVFIDFLRYITGAEGKEQHDHGEHQVWETVERIAETQMDQQDRRHEHEREEYYEDERWPVGISADLAKAEIHAAIQPPELAQMKQLRCQALDKESDQ
jgi:hypothetical protein